MTRLTNDKIARISLICAVLTLIGCLAPVIGDIVGSVAVIHYSPISETISDLAAGRKSWIMDSALQFFGIGIIACSVGLYIWKLNGLTWKISSFLLSLVGIDIIVIAQRNIYGDNESWGIEIHLVLVLIMGVLFGLLTWLYGDGLSDISRFWLRFTRTISILWFVLAPFFFLIPTEWNGAYERFLAILMLTWLLMMAWLLSKPYRDNHLVAPSHDRSDTA